MDTNTNETKRKFTDKQLRLYQIILGILAAAALIFTIALPMIFKIKKDDLLNYSFVVVFLAVILGRRTIENKYRLRLSTFTLSLMLGICAGLVFYVMNIFYWSGDTVQLEMQYKILITVAMILALLAGIIIPIVRYFKRKASGNLPNVRLPEPKEDVKTVRESQDDNGPLTVEQKIAAMMSSLDDKKDSKDDKKK